MTLPSTIAAALEDAALRLRARFGERVKRVALFGSWARGEATESSDIDIAVVIAGLDRAEWREAIDLITADEVDTDVFFSPYVVSAEHFEDLLRRERRLARDIVEQGIAR